jgi:iron complex transport system permease protein
LSKKEIFLLTVFFIFCILFALCSGRYPISPMEVFGLLLDRIGLDGFLTPPSHEMQLIFWNIRVPRIIMSFVVGGGISIAGAVFQALFRNPLAAPDFMGVTDGSCFGAALAIIFITSFAFGIQTSAFIFGVIAISLVYLLASRSWDRSASVLVISGIVISALFQAGLFILMYIANPYDQLAQIVFWIMGSFHVSSWAKVQSTLPIVVICSLLIYLFSWRLNVMTQEDEDALSLGINIFRWRLFYVLISALIVACSVASVGKIMWVGLIIPHIARYLAGMDHARLIPLCAFLGGTFLLLMDTIARSIMASEIPISIVTSIVGAPFLGYLVLNRKGVGIWQ